MSVEFTPEEIRTLVRRAHEIESAMAKGQFESGTSADAFLAAAEEAGISRDAAEAALRERLQSIPLDSAVHERFEPGTLVFVKSDDDHGHPAKVIAHEDDRVRIRFVSGTEHVARPEDVRRFSVRPGQSIEFNSTTYMMWVKGSAVRFSEDALSLTISYWGSEETVPLDRVRTPKEKSGALTLADVTASGKAWAFGLLGLVTGTATGAFVTWLITR